MWESKSTTIRKGAQTFGTVLYYLACCPFVAPQRTIDFLRSVYFYRQEEKIRWLDQTLIPTVAPDQLFPGLFENSVRLLELGKNRRSATTLLESYVLASVVRFVDARTLFEFGTFEGRTTLQLALNSPDEAVVYTLDLPQDFTATQYKLSFPEESQARRLPVGGLFQPYEVAGKIKQIYADSARANYESLRGKVDFIFIDADHGYNYVKSDSENAFSMLSSKGVILWHDYASRWRDVTLYLREVVKQQDKRIYHLAGTNLAIYAPSASLPPKTRMARSSEIPAAISTCHQTNRIPKADGQTPKSR